MHKPHLTPRDLASCFIVAALTITLVGCEAALDLSGVNAELARPIHRADLFQAATRNQDNVMAVGGMGVVVQSHDRGTNWQRTTLPGKPFLIDVAVCPNGTFYAIEKTAGIWTLKPDGEWARQELPELTEPQALACDYNNVLWIVAGYSTILHSRDAGVSWEEWSMEEDLYLTTIQFIDQTHGVVTGEFGTVLLTDDTGKNWTRANDLPDSFYPQSTYFNSPDTGWVVGLSGTIWQTNDGAENWQLVQSGINTPLYGISGYGNTLVAVGDNTSILYYTMGDSHWSELADTTLSRSYLRGVTALGNGEYVVAGGGGTLIAITLPDKQSSANEGISNE